MNSDRTHLVNNEQRLSEFRGFRREIIGCLIAHCVLWLPVLLLVRPGDEIRPMISVAGSMLVSLAATIRGLWLAVPKLFQSGDRRTGAPFRALGMMPLIAWIGTEVFLHLVLGVRYGR